jgi:formylmethanofuran dehydrogenase subunit B
MTQSQHETRSTCCYCGVGCGVIIEHDGSRITGVKGDPDHPANFGRLCTKGSTLHLSARPDTRALHPELRTARDLPRSRVSWDAALAHAADRFAAIIDEHGPDAVAFYISGQLLTEDYYVFNKLAKGLIGTNNVDTNSRLCMSSAVSAYKQTLGADAPPCSYEDIDHTDCLLIAGGNPAYAHPIVYRRIEDARRANPAMKMIVVDPRRTDTASDADLHLPLLPGTDIWLYNAARAAVGRSRRRHVHRRAYRRLRRVAQARARHHAGGRRRGVRPARRGHRHRRQVVRRIEGCDVDVVPGPEPVASRHAQRNRADRAAPVDRPDRSPGRRPVLADRPAQCDGRSRSGRHGQSAVGPP